MEKQLEVLEICHGEIIDMNQTKQAPKQKKGLLMGTLFILCSLITIGGFSFSMEEPQPQAFLSQGQK